MFPIVARKSKGTNDILHELEFLKPDDRQVFKIDYGKEIEDAIERMSLIIKQIQTFQKNAFVL